MKKIISTILCISLLSSIICIPVSATEDVVASESIEEFCEDVNEMVTEYSDSEFVTPEFIEEEQATEYTSEEIEINYCSRLIVQSDKPIDTYNAVDVVSGFSNFYIVQFENEEDTNSAYKKYSYDKNIVSVEYDVSYAALLGTTQEETEAETELTYKDYKNGWYLQSTGMDIVLEKYKEQNLPEVVVAVLDTGVDLSCEYLQDRIIRTGFNSSGDNTNDSEQDYSVASHGTMVSSVIANCTTDNVKIANYRCINSNGVIPSVTCITTAILKALNNGADVINCSFGYDNSDSKLLTETLKTAYKEECTIVVAAGNSPSNLERWTATPLEASGYTLVVGSNDKYNVPSGFTTYGKPIHILAPGEDIPVIDINNKITLASGTSFSAPIMTSVYAMFYAVNQQITFEERLRSVKNSGDGTDEKYVTEYFGSGIVNAVDLFDLNTVLEPVYSLESGKYVGEVVLELSAEENADIYYTTDYTYPSPTNGILYTEPIRFLDDDLRIRAVAYKNGIRSNFIAKDICSAVLGTDDMFTVNEKGVITEYKGNVKYLKIPEIVNGITVVDINKSSGLNTAELYGLILPDTMRYLGKTLNERPVEPTEQLILQSNETLKFVLGKNIEILGMRALGSTSSLREVDFPNCKEIYSRAFFRSSLIGANFPKVESVDNFAFQYCGYLREIYLPICKEMGSDVFVSSVELNVVYAPLITNLQVGLYNGTEHSVDNQETGKKLFYENKELYEIDLPNFKTLGTDAFFSSAIKRLELSNAINIFDLPTTVNNNGSLYSSYYQPVSVELSLPSTLQYCIPATDYKNEYIEYVVYGTADKGGYAEQWAKENDIKFINISQETAIVEDIEPVWDKYSYKPLEFDARGFNRTYQWYGSYDNKIGEDILLNGYTEKSFNPDDSKSYPYYYCVMTSTDVNTKGEIVSSVDITSSMCENRLYYMFALPDTHINFDNKLIYTKQFVCRDFLEIVYINENTTYFVTPSHSYKNNCWYGTGSQLQIQDADAPTENTYTLIVEGDINGDSAVDVLDAAYVALVTNGHQQLTDTYFLAADTNSDEEITVEDYAQVVNLVLAG